MSLDISVKQKAVTVPRPGYHLSRGSVDIGVSVKGGEKVETFYVGRDENGLTISAMPRPVVSGGGGD